jgi:hypothetical protein
MLRSRARGHYFRTGGADQMNYTRSKFRRKNATIDGNSLISFFFQVIYPIWELDLSY